jgi:hypothetical protein
MGADSPGKSRGKDIWALRNFDCNSLLVIVGIKVEKLDVYNANIDIAGKIS